ncbi:MAG TPA: DUF2125 domain-containing protein [Stellaceae bacterium]|jgi:hypothetical protein|nr:DUF2125 domain-containing protein [Stellaceae bacterium]
MRRPVRLGLIAAIIVIVGVGAYSWFWWVAAGKLKDGAAGWAEAARAQGIDASWQGLRVAGYPFRFRAELTGARLAGAVPGLTGELTAPFLTATIATTDLHAATLTAPEGLTLVGAGFGSLKAESGVGTVAAGAQGGAAIWLQLDAVTASATAIPDGHAAAKTAQLWVDLPPTPARTHDDRTIGVALDLTGLSVPHAPQALGATIDDAAVGATLMGPVALGASRQAAAAWRDGGGTLELNHLHLGWGGLDLDAKGTLALDRDLQPEGTVSGSLGGYDQLLGALVAGGLVKGSDASRMRLVLGLLARPGPDGKPRLAAALSLQDGVLSMGPLTFGRVPRIEWGK